MEIIVFLFILAVVVGAVASSRGRSFFGWFLLSLFISPVISLLILLVVGRKESARSTYYDPALGRSVEMPPVLSGLKRCPDCAEMVQSEARICRYCRHAFAAPEIVAPPPKVVARHSRMCSACGRENQPGASLCRCGVRLA